MSVNRTVASTRIHTDDVRGADEELGQRVGGGPTRRPPGPVLVTLEGDEAAVRDVLGDETAALDGNEGVALRLHDQRRCVDQGEDVADVDLEVQLVAAAEGARGPGQPFEATEPAQLVGVTGNCGFHDRQEHARAPSPSRPGR